MHLIIHDLYWPFVEEVVILGAAATIKREIFMFNLRRPFCYFCSLPAAARTELSIFLFGATNVPLHAC